MEDLAEDRVYSGGGDETLLFVASAQGLLRVRVSGDRVGEFGLVTRRDARDVAADSDRIVLGTAESLLVGPDGSGLRDTGVGPAQAVGIDDDGWVMGGPDGSVHRETETGSRSVGHLSDIHAIDPPLIGTADGVFLLEGLSHAGLEQVRDVAASPMPRAATANALYKLGNGWIEELTGDTTMVSSRGRSEAAAVREGVLHWLDEDAWISRSIPVNEPIADVLLGPGIYVITTEGTLLVDAGSGWRTRALGIADVRGMTLQRRPA